MVKPLTVFVAIFFYASLGLGQDLPGAAEVRAITEKVADWQIETFEDMGKYRALPSGKNRQAWHHRNQYHDLEWQCGALYAGMYQLCTFTGNNKYVEWLNTIGKRNDWRLHKRIYHADDHVVGQFYLNLYQHFEQPVMMEPTRARFDSIMQSEKGSELHWDWCDALFMAPPVWARLAKITGEEKYLEYMDEQYHMTYDLLWDEENALFFRDASYFDQSEKNGEKIFWARGNGWVFGGLALMIPDLPDNWSGKQFYIDLYKHMAQTLKERQRSDGTWSGGILGSLEDYPTIETSGSSFFTFGLTWGINNGILDRETFEPVILKAWDALVGAVHSDGMLGYVQPVGAAPGESFKDYTEVYGIGAFLAAGAEMYKYVDQDDEWKQNRIEQGLTTFLQDGGWCWYQDPRAVISKSKLVVAGVSGVSGDVKIGVYDLVNQKIEGEVILDQNFETDDHDVPALHVRADGSILAVWARHGSDKIHYYRISSPNNYLEWSERKEFVHDYAHRMGVTYMNLYETQNDGLLYNFFRDGSNFNPSFITSSDGGESWGNRTHFLANDISGYQRPYARYLQKDANTIAFSYSDAHPRDFGNSLYYAEFRNGTFYDAAGNELTKLESGPLRSSQGEKIYTGSETAAKPADRRSVPNSAWTCAMAKDKNGRPVIGYTVYWKDDDHRYRTATWNGKKWIDKEIAHAGDCLYSWESSYTGLMAFDPEDPRNVYISTDVNPNSGNDPGSVHEIYSARIKGKDDVSKIRWKPVTSNSVHGNIRPIVVAGEGYKVLLWLNGKYHTYRNYDVDVVGMILDKP